MKNTDFEIRTSELTASDKKLVGYAVRWNSLSEIIWDEFREQFTPGAFADYLAAGNDVRCLYEHDYTQLLGRTKSGSLVLTEDNTGLRFELTPPNTQLGKDVLTLVETWRYYRNELWLSRIMRGVEYRAKTVSAYCNRRRTP